MGPICASKASLERWESLCWGKSNLLTDVKSLQEAGLVCRKMGEDIFATNIPQFIIHHSPTGFAWGYGGSGPADLALNVLHLLLPPQNGKPTVTIGIAEVSPEAYALHQDLKWRFIATMPEEGARIPIEEINQWIVQKLADPKFAEAA